MARITVEDCLEVVDNRFELVLMATKRARQLAKGADSVVDSNNNKPTVVALREIADEKLKPEDLKEDLIHSLQKHVEVDEPEAETVPLLTHSVPNASSSDSETQYDRMSEDDLLRGLDGLVPPTESADDED